MKAPEIHCTFHKGIVCMANGTLHLQQAVIPGTDAYDEATKVWGIEAGEGPGAFRTEVGHFCTIHALYSWLEAQGAMKGRPGDMTARRPGSRKNADQRPVVATRRPRASLKPGGQNEAT
jgi:hypothetical protein